MRGLRKWVAAFLVTGVVSVTMAGCDDAAMDDDVTDVDTPDPTQGPMTTPGDPSSSPPVQTATPPGDGTETPGPTTSPTDPSATPDEATASPASPTPELETPGGTGQPASPTPDDTPVPTQAPETLSQRYLLTFIACDNDLINCGDPVNHMTWLALSNDGAVWEPLKNYQPFVGSMPDVIRRGDTIYLYSNLVNLQTDVDTIQVRRYRISTGTWEPSVNIDIRYPEGAVEYLVDQTLIVDEEGRLVLFYLYAPPGQFRASCPIGQFTCTKYFHSATEIDGSDGTAFIVDEGNRAVVELAGGSASDPDIFEDPDGFVFYISRGTNIQIWTSPTLRGSYEVTGASDDESYLDQNVGGVAAGYFDVESRNYWTYVADQNTVPPCVTRAIHPDFSKRLKEEDFAPVVCAHSFPGLTDQAGIGAPGFAPNVP